MLFGDRVRRIQLVAAGALTVLTVAACGGGDSSDDQIVIEISSPTPVPEASPTAPVPPTERPEAPTATPTVRPVPTATPTTIAVPTATAVAPSPTPAPTATPIPLVWSLESAKEVPTDPSFTPRPGTKAVTVVAAFTGPAAEAKLVPASWFFLKEVNGPEFPSAVLEVSASGSGDGGTASVTFEVPASATRFQLVFRPDPGEGDQLISATLQP